MKMKKEEIEYAEKSRYTGKYKYSRTHGTAGAFGPVLEDFGVKGASTLCTAAATFGLIAGSVMGGPVGKRLIEKKNLLDTVIAEDDSLLIEDEKKHERHASMYPSAVFQLIIAIGIGTIISKLLSLTGMTFPIYIGAMIAAACMRNIGEYSGKFTIYMGEINDIGGISLSLFLGIAMITLKLWQLADLALPLITLLAGQTILMFLYTYFVVFNVMGRDYDAAVLSSGVCGFGMGATPNAMANMQAVCEKYAPSVKAFLLVPLVGSLFADFLNSLAITFFINFLSVFGFMPMEDSAQITCAQLSEFTAPHEENVPFLPCILERQATALSTAPLTAVRVFRSQRVVDNA